MHVIHEQKENGQVEKLSQPIAEDIYKKRMDIFLNQHRFPPAQKIVTRKLASEALFDDSAWSEENWQETLKKKDIASSSVNVPIMSNECIMAKENLSQQTPFNTKKPKFSEMSDEAKKEYFKNLYKKGKEIKNYWKKKKMKNPVTSLVLERITYRHKDLLGQSNLNCKVSPNIPSPKL